MTHANQGLIFGSSRRSSPSIPIRLGSIPLSVALQPLSSPCPARLPCRLQEQVAPAEATSEGCLIFHFDPLSHHPDFYGASRLYVVRFRAPQRGGVAARSLILIETAGSSFSEHVNNDDILNIVQSSLQSTLFERPEGRQTSESASPLPLNRRGSAPSTAKWFNAEVVADQFRSFSEGDRTGLVCRSCFSQGSSLVAGNAKRETCSKILCGTS